MNETEPNWLKRENGLTHDKPLTEAQIQELTKKHAACDHKSYRAPDVKYLTGFGKNKIEQYQKRYCQFYKCNGDEPSRKFFLLSFTKMYK
jgi:hypothetical protein